MRTLALFAALALAACARPVAHEHAPAAPAQVEPPPAPAKSKASRYTCPMHPDYVLDHPGDCPICNMKLVPVEEPAAPPPSAAGAAPLAHDLSPVSIDPERRRILGIKILDIKAGEIRSVIRTVGRVARDERRVVRVQPRFEGFIEKLYADFTGKAVRRGEALAAVYSPELLATQNEYLLARKARSTLAESGLPEAADSARSRLRLLGVSDAQIAELEARGAPLQTIDVTAPIAGVVMTKNAVAGARIGTDAPLFEIVDLSRVWVLADVYENELPRLRVGQSATLTLAYWPDRKWQGKVGYVFPTVDEKTRTVRVRIEVDNARSDLKLDMFGDVVLEAAPRRALLVAEDAVIDSGARKVVFAVSGPAADGRLVPREIRTGAVEGGHYEVLDGLKEGEQVASGASFLLDSESRLRAALAAPRSTTSDGGRP